MKTITKLENLCKPHGVDLDAFHDADWGEWRLYFYAPAKMQWNSSTATCAVFVGPLVSAVKWLREELSMGFSPASYSQLRDTDQLD